MKSPFRYAVLVAGLSITGWCVADDEVRTEADARAALESSGYVEVEQLAFEDRLWTARAVTQEGRVVDVVIDAEGAVYPQEEEPLSEADAEALLAAAGFSQVEELQVEGDKWKAEAVDSEGEQVVLEIDPIEARVAVLDDDE